MQRLVKLFFARKKGVMKMECCHEESVYSRHLTLGCRRCVKVVKKSSKTKAFRIAANDRSETEFQVGLESTIM